MYTLLIPRNPSRREPKTGGGPFWDSFWKKEVSQNTNQYTEQYRNRIQRSKHKLSAFNEEFTTTSKNFYADVVLDERAASKSTRPSKVWTEAGLDIVATREEGDSTILTIGGKSEDFIKLENLVDSSSFDIASAGSGAAGNIAREVYAVSDFLNINNSISGRVSLALQELLNQNHTGELDCIIEIHSNEPLSRYEDIFSLLVATLGTTNVKKRNTEFFLSNSSYFAKLTIEMVRALLNDVTFNFIYRIKLTPHFLAQRTTPNTTLGSVTIGEFLTDEIVGLIDSGIENTVLNPMVTHRMNLLPSGARESAQHGTNVASRFLFGDSFFVEIAAHQALRPTAHIVDIKVLSLNSEGAVTADIDNLMLAITQFAQRLSDVTIFNLSVTAHEPIREGDRFDELTELIDKVSSELDILFVIAVGNQTGNYQLGYEDIFNVPDHYANICMPSDSINSLSVGSIVKSVGVETLCTQINHPSPFTRKGGIRDGIKKPELVAHGGNVRTDPTGLYGPSHNEASKNTYGVDVFSQTDFGREVGTSLSTPLISREAALLLNYLKKSNLPTTLTHFQSNKSNLLRALLIHSTSQRIQEEITDAGVKKAFGFGEADHALALLHDSEDQVNIVYADRITDTEKKHKLMIKLPEGLLGKNVEFTITTAYNPPVNKTIKEYKLIDISTSMRLVMPVLEDGQVIDFKYTSLLPTHSWEQYRSNKYSTIAHFTKKTKRLKCVDLEVMMGMTVSDFLDKQNPTENITQDYALILTIKDLSMGGFLREQILQLNALEELVQNVIEVNVI